MASRFVNPLVMWTLIVLGGGVIFFGFGVDWILFRTDLARFIFTCAFVYWLYFVLLALWENRNAVRSVAGVKSLVKTGVYAHVRHPIYAADILLMWGIFFMIPSLAMLLIALWVTFVLFTWMCLEEGYLAKRFKVAYADYRARVPMIFPCICRAKKSRSQRKRKPKKKIIKSVEDISNNLPQAQ